MNWLEALNQVRLRIAERERERKQREIEARQRPREVVVNSPDIRWKPIDRTAAFVVSKANWICKPDIFNKQQTKEQKMRRVNVATVSTEGFIPGSSSEEEHNVGGVPIKSFKDPKTGETMFTWEDMEEAVIKLVEKTVMKDLPEVKADMEARAKDARAAIEQATQGLGGDIDRFRQDCKKHLEEIRQTRFAVLGEVREMIQPLKEVRQFFMGPDYKGEVARLKEFVELCERLSSLKESGFLDKIADTMLALDIKS